MNNRHLRRPQTHIEGDPPLPVHRVLRGKLATAATDTGIVQVLVKSFSTTLQVGPVHGCKPQVVPHGTGAAEAPLYARLGDTCWVVQDEEHTWVMVTWEAS